MTRVITVGVVMLFSLMAIHTKTVLATIGDRVPEEQIKTLLEINVSDKLPVNTMVAYVAGMNPENVYYAQVVHVNASGDQYVIRTQKNGGKAVDYSSLRKFAETQKSD